MATWRAFADEANVKIWGKAFKWARRGPRTNTPPSTVRKVDGTNTTNVDETSDALLKVFVPEDIDGLAELHYESSDDNTLVSSEEVKSAIWKI